MPKEESQAPRINLLKMEKVKIPRIMEVAKELMDHFSKGVLANLSEPAKSQTMLLSAWNPLSPTSPWPGT